MKRIWWWLIGILIVLGLALVLYSASAEGALLSPPEWVKGFVGK